MSARQYKELGNTGIKVSKIGVGTWQFGQTADWGPANIEECQKVIDYAIDSGVNFFDTAEAYGESEKILGELLKGKRDKVFLATKIGGQQWDYDTVRKRIEGSLKRLQVDYIDLYQIHWPKIKHLPECKKDMEKKDYEDIFTSLNKLKEQGLIRFAGVSNFRLHHVKEFSDKALDFLVTNQVPYSLLWRFYDVEGVGKFCQQKNISLLTYSPLAQGLLTGRFGKDGEKITEETRKINILFNEPVYTRALKVVDVVKEIAQEVGSAPAQVALKWTMERKVVATVLGGVRKLKHLKDNIAALEIQLTNEQINRLNEASLKFQASMPLGLEMWIPDNKEGNIRKLGIKR